jgi:putative resolvase
MKVSIGQAAQELGVSPETFRRWEAAGKIEVERTPHRHRRYDLSRLHGLVPYPRAASRPTLAYACVWSGLNDNQQGLQQLIQRIGSGVGGRLVLTHQNRLLRFGSELVFALCEAYNIEVVIINQGKQPVSCAAELAPDGLEISTVFSARLAGRRSPKNRKVREALGEAAEQR